MGDYGLMKHAGYFGTYLILTLDRLRQQRWLLAGLVLLCLLLPLGAGKAANALLSQGVDFSGVTLAITAPEGDPVPRQLEQYMGEMEDVAQYCAIVSMDSETEAVAALKRGEVTAVLVLPENFIRGVMWGENPDLRLITAGDRPLESLLLLWVGQSASDILSAFQSGVYAVLDLYEADPPPGLTRDQVVMDDGLFEMLLVPNPASGAELQALIRALVLQDFTGGGVVFRHVPAATVTTPEGFPWTLDGEFGSGAEKVEIRNLPQRLEFLL